MRFRHYLPLLMGLLPMAAAEDELMPPGEPLLPFPRPEQVLPAAGDANHAAVEETLRQRNERMDWWRRAKFGMFIHYGLYSGLAGEFMGQQGGGEWIQRNLKLDSESYAAEALPLFKPAPGCTEAWAELAEAAGCYYMVLTTKHHDGFALWKTEQGDFSAQAAVGRDLVREFVESARAHDMRVGFYYSVIDWHHPDYDNTICPKLCYPEGQEAWLKQRNIPRDQAAYKRFLHAQVRELLGNYGDIDIMWWDYSQGAAEGERAWGAPALIKLCREMQTGAIMNNRLYAYSGLDPASDNLQLDLRCGDFTTPEKHIPAGGHPGIDWEACLTVGQNWGYNRYDTQLKSPAFIIRRLQECAARGGNLLLNINPRADGSVPEGVADCLRRIGAWMDVNGEAIYDSYPLPDITLPEGVLCAQVEEDMYVFLPEEPPADGSDYELRLRATEIDAVWPTILGQPDCELTMERIEEPGEDEPVGILRITIPAAAWADAVEGVPVLRLENDM